MQKIINARCSWSKGLSISFIVMTNAVMHGSNIILSYLKTSRQKQKDWLCVNYNASIAWKCPIFSNNCVKLSSDLFIWLPATGLYSLAISDWTVFYDGLLSIKPLHLCVSGRAMFIQSSVVWLKKELPWASCFAIFLRSCKTTCMVFAWPSL